VRLRSSFGGGPPTAPSVAHDAAAAVPEINPWLPAPRRLREATRANPPLPRGNDSRVIRCARRRNLGAGEKHPPRVGNFWGEESELGVHVFRIYQNTCIYTRRWERKYFFK